MKKILCLLMCLVMVFALCACAAPAVSNPDGSDTVTGVAIKTGLEVMEALALAIISVAGAAWASKAKNKAELQNISIAMEHVEAVAKQTVGELKQTIVDQMKEESPDGKLTPAQIEGLKSTLLSLTLKKLDDPTKELIASSGADICALISGAAEDWIATSKWLNAIPIPATLVSSEEGETEEEEDEGTE